MADIKFDIEVTGIKELKQAADNFNRLGKVSSQLAAQYKPLGAQTNKIVKEHSAYIRVQKQLNAAVAQGVITQKEADRAQKEALRVAKERILTDKTLIAQAKKRQKAEEDARKETARLTKEYAPARAAADLYKKKVQEITQAQRRNIITEEEAKRSLQLLTREYYNFTQGAATGGNQFAKFNVETYKANQRLKRFTSTGLQQAGYQIGDFAVQVQSGTNVAVAFGQQFSQLAGIFGPTGALVGAGVAIATAFIAPLMEARNVAKQVKTALDELSSTVSDLRGIEDTLEQVLELPLRGANAALKEYLENIKQIKFDEAVKSIRLGFDEAGKAAQAELDELQKRKDAVYDNVKAQEELLQATKAAMVSGQMAYDFDVIKNMSDTLADMRLEAGKSAGLIGAIMHDFREGMLSVGEMTLGENLDEVIDNMVAFKKEMDGSEQLTRLYAKAFDEVATKLGLTEEIQRRLLESGRLIIEANEANLNYAKEYQKSLEKQAEESEKIHKAAQKIKDETKAQVYSLKDKKTLLDLELKYGKDSAEVAAEVSFQEERAFRERMKSKGILGNNLELVMEAYRAVEAQKQELDDNNKSEKEREAILKRQVATMKLAYEFMEKQADAAKTLKDAVEAIESNISNETKSLEDRLRLAETEIEFGKDSVELSRLNAELAREAFIARAMEQGILGNNLETLLALYDKVAQAEGRVPKTTRGRGKTDAERVQEYLNSLENQRDKEKQLVGIFGEQRDLMGSLIDARQKYKDIATKDQMDVIEGYIKETHALEQQQKALEEARRQQEQLKSSIESSMEDAFMSIVDGTKTVEEAFRDMARQIIAELYRVLVVKKMVAGITSVLPFADGGVISKGNVVPYANGGVVGSPTYFPMSNGRTGLMGEAGPEAIMPLKRGKNGKLGVESSGQGNDIVVNQTINVSTGVQQTVRTEIKSLMPQIAESAKSAVMDAKRRGGSYGRSFA